MTYDNKVIYQHLVASVLHLAILTYSGVKCLKVHLGQNAVFLHYSYPWLPVLYHLVVQFLSQHATTYASFLLSLVGGHYEDDVPLSLAPPLDLYGC